jgi:hypothetical protein
VRAWRVRTRAALLLTGLFGVAFLACTTSALDILGSVSPSQLIRATGPLRPARPGPILLSFGALVLLVGMLGRRLGPADGTWGRALSWQVRLLTLGLFAGAVACTCFGVAEVRSTGRTDYYFLKFLLALGLLLAVAVAALAGVLAARTVPAGTIGRRTSIGLSLGLLVAVSQAFGPLVPGHAPMRSTVAASFGPEGGRSWHHMAVGITSAVRDRGGLDAEYVATGREAGYVTVLPSSWFHALSGSMTDRTMRRQASMLDNDLSDPRTVHDMVSNILIADETVKVVVAPDRVAAVRHAVGRALSARVVSW